MEDQKTNAALDNLCQAASEENFVVFGFMIRAADKHFTPFCTRLVTREMLVTMTEAAVETLENPTLSFEGFARDGTMYIQSGGNA